MKVKMKEWSGLKLILLLEMIRELNLESRKLKRQSKLNKLLIGKMLIEI